MKAALVFGSLITLLLGAIPSTALAQRGTGAPEGVARQAEKPETVNLSGILTEVRTAPCEDTTGSSPLGTHLILKTDDGEELNVHLGPAARVADIVAKLPFKQEISVVAFRTDALKPSHYVASSLTYGDTTVKLRDDTFRPTWAPGAGAPSPMDRIGTPPAATRGPGRGRGLGQGLGVGPGGRWNRGPQQFGRAPGSGWGPGSGRGFRGGYCRQFSPSGT